MQDHNVQGGPGSQPLHFWVSVFEERILMSAREDKAAIMRLEWEKFEAEKEERRHREQLEREREALDWETFEVGKAEEQRSALEDKKAQREIQQTTMADQGGAKGAHAPLPSAAPILYLSTSGCACVNFRVNSGKN